MAQKKSTAKKATAEPNPTVEKKITQGPTEAAKTSFKVAPAKPKPAPKATQPPPPVSQAGLYPIKLGYGAGNLKALPLPGKRALLILPNSSAVVDDIEVVAEGNAFVLR